ncbi:PREDICTED: fibropellin-1-like [Branchiostoma belcheri]|uniref:Fibropellin-1-like n=1 Tax=Branchiostoma belcheri TaxID=7741 RepID=A0A6P4ZF33_BRABE|nr:PREDICTED: fibropellin-1-like [Branchiostoma belcheri]
MFVYLPDVFDDGGACGFSWCTSGAKEHDKFALCAVAVGDCASSFCSNGSTCLDLTYGHTCLCAPGFGGNFCETDLDECSSAPCQNNATCQDGVNSFTCQCAAGYTGPSCEIDIDECVSTPCWARGTCVDRVDGYSCVCPKGFSGERCETVMYADGCLLFSSDAVSYPEASQECQTRGGHLVDVKEAELQRLIADSIPAGSDVSPWIGLKLSPGVMTYDDGTSVSDQLEWSAGEPDTSCDLCAYLDSADGHRAKTASCTERHHYVCQSEIDECSSEPCANGGICLDGLNSYRCFCQFGYAGNNCQTDLDLCAMVSCPSDWQCQDEADSASYDPCSSASCPRNMYCKKEGPASFSCRAG